MDAIITTGNIRHISEKSYRYLVDICWIYTSPGNTLDILWIFSGKHINIENHRSVLYYCCRRDKQYCCVLRI